MDSQQRKQMAYALMLLGLVCLVVSAGMVWHAHTDVEEYRVRPPSARGPSAQQLMVEQSRLARYWLLMAGGIVMVFLLASLVIVRFRRRLMAYLNPRPAPPTPVEDVWRMHKAPEPPPEEEPDENEDLPPDGPSREP